MRQMYYKKKLNIPEIIFRIYHHNKDSEGFHNKFHVLNKVFNTIKEKMKIIIRTKKFLYQAYLQPRPSLKIHSK